MAVETNTAETAPFALAKQALGFVAEFQTPPTPKVYEVWYRYAEGSNESIQQQLDHAINEAESVSVELLEQLHDQFCCENDGVSDRVSLELSNELSKLQSMISSQKSAGDDFSSSIHSASQAVEPDSKRPQEIAACISELLKSNQKMQSQLYDMGSQLEESQNQVAHLRQDLMDSQQSMMTDPLTGVGNRRYFDTMMEQAVATAKNGGVQIFLLLLDLDNFKEINDTCGHSAGDQVLKFVASETLKIRSDVSVARYGGDEFAIFLNTDDVEEASEYADQVRRFFSTGNLRATKSGESLGRVSLSVGAARLRPDDDTHSWFDRADRLLYKAKEAGANCVMVERQLDR